MQPDETPDQNPTPRYTVVLTGGVASGKTTVSRMFEKRGAAVIDTDVIAREVVQPGQAALEQIVTAFGRDVLLPDGGLDREQMRARIFSDPAAREMLERILHPVIRSEALRQLERQDAPYCILVIPLYVENKGFLQADRVLVIDTAEHVQVKRLVERDGISEAMAQAILQSQAPREDRLAIADDVINNHGSTDRLDAAVEALHQEYLGLAREHACRQSAP